MDMSARLAQALENYEPGDPRNKKFLNYPLRSDQPERKSKKLRKLNMKK